MVKVPNIKRLSLSVILITALLMPTLSYSATVEKIVAAVDGTAITMYELDQAMSTYGPEIRKKYNATGTTLRAKVLDRLIDEKVFEIALKSSSITVEPHEVDTFIDRILRSSRITLDVFKQHLAERGLTYETYRKNVEKEILRNKFVNDHVGRKISVSERELKDYFLKHMDEFKSSSSVRLAQVSIIFTPTTTQDNFKEIETLALNIQRSAASSSNFEALAKRYSSDKFRVEGGNLGVVKMEDLQPRIAQVASMLYVGQASQPILTATGIHIIKVLDRAQTSTKDFMSVREQVNNVVYDMKIQQALEGYVKRLRRQAQVDIKGL